MVRELLMILFVTGATLSSQLLIKAAVAQLEARTPGLTGVEWLIAIVMSSWMMFAILLQGVGFLVWVTVVSRMKLGVAVGLAGASMYILLPLVTWWVYGERLLPTQWLGLVLITVGVLLVSMIGRGG